MRARGRKRDREEEKEAEEIERHRGDGERGWRLKQVKMSLLCLLSLISAGADGGRQSGNVQ